MNKKVFLCIINNIILNLQLPFDVNTYMLERYPTTFDKSLLPWDNALLLSLEFISDKEIGSIHLFNDRFGVWNCVLHNKQTTTIWTYASQKKAIIYNLQLNNLNTAITFKTPLDILQNIDVALLKVPKSMALFELFLSQIHKSSSEKTMVVCCFMTKYFSASMLKIASKYFDFLEQSKAWKKARLLILKQPKKLISQTYIKGIQWKDRIIYQYYGVFSSDKIDMGTQFLLHHLKLRSSELNILDVASGNGIIAYEIALRKPEATLTLVDDFNLAIDSSKINIKKRNSHFICDDGLCLLPQKSFDLVVSNPPFHFEYENNIAITLNLFREIKQCLTKKGRFVLVANKHLNYKTHLTVLFKEVKELAQNKKFIIYECF